MTTIWVLIADYDGKPAYFMRAFDHPPDNADYELAMAQLRPDAIEGYTHTRIQAMQVYTDMHAL